MVDSIYAWQEWGPDERWGTIAAAVPALGGAGPLVARSLPAAYAVEAIARGHGRASGNKVALRRYEFVEEV